MTVGNGSTKGNIGAFSKFAAKHYHLKYNLELYEVELWNYGTQELRVYIQKNEYT